MSDATPELVELEEQITAVVRGSVPLTELADFFDRSFGALAGAIAEQQVEILGPAFALYHEPPSDTADLEVGFVTDRGVEPSGGVTPSTLPACRAATVAHHGNFDGLGGAWHGLGGWIAERGLVPQDTMWEVYVTEPSPDMDPADLRTELFWPLTS